MRNIICIIEFGVCLAQKCVYNTWSKTQQDRKNTTTRAKANKQHFESSTVQNEERKQKSANKQK